MGIAALFDTTLGNHDDAFIEIIFLLIAIPLYLYYIHTKNLQAGKYGLAFLAALPTYLLLFTNNFQTSFFHIIVPIGFFLLFSFKEAVWLTAAHQTMVIFSYLIGYNFMSDTSKFPSGTILIGIGIASLFVLLFGLFYYLSIETSYRKLQESHQEKEKLLEEIRVFNRQLQERVDEAVAQVQAKEQLLQQQLRMAQMGEMLSMIAHQWRQPLAAISSTMMLIERHIETDKFHMHTKEGLQTFLDVLTKKHEEIEENITYLSNTTEDFRNLFNPHTQKEPVCVNEAVQKAIPLIESAIKNRNILLQLNLNAQKSCSLYTNEVMQVVLNLLKNASDALSSTNLKERIISLSTYDASTHSIIEITDNGKGISASHLPHIFDPYFTTKGKKIGTGLGLYMAKNIIEEHHNGQIEVESRPGHTCFQLFFPLL